MGKLYKHQEEAVERLQNGNILCGDVGTGKSRTALAYFLTKVCGASLDPDTRGDIPSPMDVVVITTARKRDSLEWEGDAAAFGLSTDRSCSFGGLKLTVDSWNNIGKYVDVRDCFFVFDEQRVVGSGAWVKAFLKIVKNNRWILLSATPGDTWLDYIPVFIANGFYKNRTEFKAEHVIYKPHRNFDVVDRYIGTKKLKRHLDSILVDMAMLRHTIRHREIVPVEYSKEDYKKVYQNRWNIFTDQPIMNASQWVYCLRWVANEHSSRMEAILRIWREKKKVIIFYGFDHELSALISSASWYGIKYAQWNGHAHEPVPDGDEWMYFVQYRAGAEGWNCTTCDTVIFMSLDYSYRTMMQAEGRIDRLNTPYRDLYYYYLRSYAPIDNAIMKALKAKKDFNARSFSSDF